MKDLISNDKATIAALADRLKRAQSHSEYQRIQCVLIRATLGSSAAQIAQLLGWSAATVHVLHSRWASEGDAVFDVRGRAYLDMVNNVSRLMAKNHRAGYFTAFFSNFFCAASTGSMFN